jgi:hypothetical protein
MPLGQAVGCRLSGSLITCLDIRHPTAISPETFRPKSANLISDKQEDIMAKGNNARKKETKKPKKDKK